MADQDMMHTAEIMKAALPFIDPKTRVMAEFFTKIFDLMGSLKAMTSVDHMAACGYESGESDIEGMFTVIRPLCTNKEREFIDRILSMFNAKRMFEMYNNIMSTMKTMQGFGGDASDMAGGFAGFNFDSIFGNSTNKAQPDSDTESHADTKTDFFGGFEQSGETNSSSEKEQSTQTGFKGNNQMFDMLKAMVPPEQMSTFENLSMLLNTMSYDNNKPDDSKEHKDG
ncbi:MAG: hypothetical protein ACYDEX_21760 [Mobilitalea sp.]